MCIRDRIKVVDYTDIAIHMKELMFVRINNCSDRDIDEIFKISQVFQVSIIDYSPATVLIESVHTETRTTALIALLEKCLSLIHILNVSESGIR